MYRWLAYFGTPLLIGGSTHREARTNLASARGLEQGPPGAGQRTAVQ